MKNKRLIIAFILSLVLTVSTGCGKSAENGVNDEVESLKLNENISETSNKVPSENEVTDNEATEKSTTKANGKDFSSTASTFESIASKETTAKTTTKKSTTKPITKPTTKPTTTAAPSGSRVTGFESEMLTVINQYRLEVGAGPLTTTATLNNAAAARAKELLELFDHTRPDGSACFTALDEYGISYYTAAENIAYGQSSVSSVMNSWYNSAGHKANMQDASFGHAGFGCYMYNGTRYWVQLFTD